MTVEPRVADAAVGGAIADVAMGMVGTRYLYGGTDPLEGFDCSGLVYYAYEQAGYRVPRTSRELFRAARKISIGDADPGAMLFRYTAHGEFGGDTWHPSVDAAREHAIYDYSDALGNWVDVPDEVRDAHAYAIQFAAERLNSRGEW